jgi:hypothetical protein
MPKAEHKLESAVLGSDGVYHLLTDAGFACGEAGKDETVHHRYRYYAITDGNRYRAPGHVAVDPEDTDRWRLVNREYEWDVDLTNIVVDPQTVRPRQRCSLMALRSPVVRWPGFVDSTSKIGAVKRALVEAFGRKCQCCNLSPGTIVDHDHLTGAVRGLLCADCNTRVEYCTHLSGCAFAEYLNSPPAAPLALIYPKPRKSASDHRKEELIQHAMAELPVSLADWHWNPGPIDDGFYPLGYDFTSAIGTAKAVVQTVGKCECNPDAGGYHDYTYMAAFEFTRHDLCGQISSIAYRCISGCQRIECINDFKCHCSACDMVVCGGCLRVPRRSLTHLNPCQSCLDKE